tara:strand:+ start:1291 stop:2106 length:816 start_codon:yes stop_codon:yes gene_type:complete
MAEVKNVIAVASGKGGVGKSTVSVNLALSLLARGAKVGLLDADIYGPSIPLMLGVLDQKPTTPDNKTFTPIEAYGLQLMSIGFIVSEDQATIWRGPMLSQALSQLLLQTNWSSLDYLIIDLPPGTGDAQLTLCQKANLTGAVLVSTPQQVALLDVKKSLEAFKKLSVPIVGLIENMSYFICPECGHEENIFGEGATDKFLKNNKIPLLAKIPIEPAFASSGDTGKPLVIGSDKDYMKAIYNDLASSLVDHLERIEKPTPKVGDIAVEVTGK